MHYLFLDEKYSEIQAERSIVVAAWAVDQGVLNNHLTDLQLPGKASLLTRIDSALERLNALALVARASLSKSLFRAGEVDSCDDIPAMARPDTIWSMATVFVVGLLVRDLGLKGQNVSTVDLHFDPKSFKASHRVAWETTIRNLVTKEAKRFGSQLGVETFRHLKIRRIEFVRKSQQGETPSKFQLGTEVADRLCTKSSEIFNGSRFSRIKRRDMSAVIARTVRQWDGMSLYA